MRVLAKTKIIKYNIEPHPWSHQVVVGLAVELGQAAAEAAPANAEALAAAARPAAAAARAPPADGDEEDDGGREGDEDGHAEGQPGPGAAQQRHGDRPTNRLGVYHDAIITLIVNTPTSL